MPFIVFKIFFSIFFSIGTLGVILKIISLVYNPDKVFSTLGLILSLIGYLCAVLFLIIKYTAFLVDTLLN